MGPYWVILTWSPRQKIRVPKIKKKVGSDFWTDTWFELMGPYWGSTEFWVILWSLLFRAVTSAFRIGLHTLCDKIGQNSVEPLNLLMSSHMCVPKTLVQTILSRCCKKIKKWLRSDAFCKAFCFELWKAFFCFFWQGSPWPLAPQKFMHGAKTRRDTDDFLGGQGSRVIL